MRLSATPGKCLLKKEMSVSGLASRVAKCEAGRKRVDVKDLSRDGMAMNIKSPAGQIWRWLGEIWKSPVELGAMWNSHHIVSMYSCVYDMRANFIR